MARIETLVADELITIPGIAALTDQRVFDVDYRVYGWNTAPASVLDADGLVMPTIVVDLAPSVRPLGAPVDSMTTVLYVWAFGSRFPDGVEAVAELMERTRWALHQWQEPTTKALLLNTGSLGRQYVEDGTFDRQEFAVTGIPRQE